MRARAYIIRNEWQDEGKKIKEIAVKDKRLGQNANSGTFCLNLYRFWKPLRPRRCSLNKGANSKGVGELDEEAEADALSDAESSDDDTSDSSSEDESDGEYEFIKKNGPKKPQSVHIFSNHTERR